MTELQWLIKILTKEKLSAHLKDLFIERIGEVETKLSPQQAMRPIVNTLAQAASTQRILDEMAVNAPVIRAPTPPAPIDKETGRAMVKTGNGTAGPRKF